MNRFNSLTKPLMWFMTLLMVAFVAGCGGGSSSSASVPSLLNSAKAINTFSLAWSTGTTGSATGTIDQALKTIKVAVPHATLLNKMTATFTASPGVDVTVDTVLQVSGSTNNDYTLPLSYKVTAADGTYATYTVLVSRDQTVTSLAVGPATPTTPLGATKQFLAAATYLDTSIDDVTATATWTSAASSVASVGSFDTTGTPGLATGLALGTSDITAAFGGKTATTALTVTNAAVVSLAITPASGVVAVGSAFQFQATGTYTDGTTGAVGDVTTTASWTSGDVNKATVGPHTGAASGVAATAALTPVVITATIGTVSNTADLTVTASPSLLGLAAPFATADTAAFTNVGATTINGDVLMYPTPTCNTSSLSGSAGDFTGCGLPVPTFGGTYHVFSSVYDPGTRIPTIQSDLNAAFLSLCTAGRPAAACSGTGGTVIGTIGGVAGAALVANVSLFTPGTYTSNSTIDLTGDITLDGQNNPNAVFIFQAGTALNVTDGAAPPMVVTPASGTRSRVLLTNGAKASNVWWSVGTSAIIGTYDEFQGSVLAAVSVTMKTGATACGRLLAGSWVGGGGAATFGDNIISVPGQPFAPPTADYSSICQ